MDRENVYDFFAVMERMREFNLDQILDSSYVIKALERARNRGLTSEEIRWNVFKMVEKMDEGKEYSRLYFKKYK